MQITTTTTYVYGYRLEKKKIKPSAYFDYIYKYLPKINNSYDRKKKTHVFW